MSRTAGRLGLITPVALLGIVLVISCLGDPSSPRPRTAHLALAPGFASGTAGVVEIDYVRVVFQRTVDSSVVLDTTVQLQPSDSIVDVTLSVPLEGEQETFWVTIECYSPTDDLVFVGGPLEVTATASTDVEPATVPIEIEYVGVGSNAVAVRIIDPEATVLFGDTITLTATALDGWGRSIAGTPIKWGSLTPEISQVPDEAVGLVIAGSQRGVAQIEARLFTGQADTGFVLVQPAPSEVVVVSGDSQNGIVGMALSEPIVARVLGQDGLPYSGVTVFFMTSDGGSFSQESAVTDTEGLVSTTWILGSPQGEQTAVATLAGVGSPQTTFTATAGLPILAPVSGDNQLGIAGEPLAQPLVVGVTMADGAGIPGLRVDFSTPDGGSFGQPAAITDAVGHASTTWTLGPSWGVQTATATLAGFGNPQVSFAATADSGRVATGNVLVLSNRNLGGVMDYFPEYMPGFTFDSMNVLSQTPTLAFLNQFPVVLLFEDGLFANATNVGDSVAAYVQAGGNLVLGTFYWQDRSDNPRYNNENGWGALEQIDPFTAPYGSEYRYDSLDVSSIVAHPLTQGVNSLWVNSYHGGVDAKPGTTVLARWSDYCTGCDPAAGTPLIGYRIEANGQRIVGVTVYPAYPYYGGFGGDFYRLWENALGWAIAANPEAASASLTQPLLRSHPAPADTTAANPRGGTGQPGGM
ncbi:MAG: hypothetical protein JSW71_12045 [Gemmatimonadota bacterium]|nr:MAG: hypothetical protein JSW71_12045 [Gemmatimonadota bacterium]